MSQQTNTAIVTLNKIESIINETPGKLAALSVSPEIKEKLIELANLTQGRIAGIEGAPQRFKVPEIRLRQPISNSPSIPEDCKPGQLYSSVKGMLGDSVQFIPLLRHTQRKKWMEGSKLECMSIDGVRGTAHGDCNACPYGKYDPSKPALCSKGHTFFVITPDLANIYRVDFQKSSAKAGQNILRLSEPPFLWGKVFTLAAEHKAANGRNYYSLVTRATGTKPSAEVMEVCGVLHEFLKAQYERALQRMYNPMLGGTDEMGTVEGVSGVVIDSEDDGAMDFSSSAETSI